MSEVFPCREIFNTRHSIFMFLVGKVQVYFQPSGRQPKTVFIGRTTIRSAADLTSANPIAPHLEYHELFNLYTEESGGQIMLAAQTVEVRYRFLFIYLQLPTKSVLCVVNNYLLSFDFRLLKICCTRHFTNHSRHLPAT